MFKSYLSEDLFKAIKKISPSMLLLSLTLHGLLLSIPISSFLVRKTPDGKMTSKQQQILISQSESSQFFTDNKSLVKQKDLSSTPIPTNDPQFTSQLPSPPQDATVQTKLPIPEIQATPTLTPVAPTSSDMPINSSKQVQQATDITAAVVAAPTIAPNLPKKNGVPKAPVKVEVKTPVTSPTVQTPKPVAKAPPLKTASPEASPTLHEKETFDSVLSKLNSELNFSQPENIPTTPGIQNIYGTAVNKTPQEVAASAISKLEVQGFKVSQLNNYTDGLLYAVTKNKFTEYITFTPNVEETGTVIITWSSSPLQTNTDQEN